MGLYCLPPALALTYLFCGRVLKSHAGYRYQGTYLTMIYPAVMIFACNRPIHRKLYTEILTDKGDDGTYIRNRIREHTPGYWQKLSA